MKGIRIVLQAVVPVVVELAVEQVAVQGRARVLVKECAEGNQRIAIVTTSASNTEIAALMCVRPADCIAWILAPRV